VSIIQLVAMCLGVYPHDLDAVSPRLMVSIEDSAARVDVELGHPHASPPTGFEGQDERTLIAKTDAEGNVASLSTDVCEPPVQSSSSAGAVTSDSAAMAVSQSTMDPTFQRQMTKRACQHWRRLADVIQSWKARRLVLNIQTLLHQEVSGPRVR